MQIETVISDPPGEIVEKGPQNGPGLVEQEGSVIVSQPNPQPLDSKDSRRLPSFGRTPGFAYLRLESPHDQVLGGSQSEGVPTGRPYEGSSTAGGFAGNSTGSGVREPPPPYPWQQGGATQVIPLGGGSSWRTQTFPINDGVRNVVIVNREQPRRNRDCGDFCSFCCCYCCLHICGNILCPDQ